MKIIISLITAFILTGSNLNADSTKLLFIGNSYIFVWQIPEILKKVARANGHNIEVQLLTKGGKNFQYHWKNGAASKIAEGKFDAVILQDQSFEPVADPENMMKYGKLLAEAVKKSGARTIFYLTMTYKALPKWIKRLPPEELAEAERLYPHMYEKLLKSYTELAKNTGAEIAPIGVAWKNAYDLMPDISLHSPDNTHQSEYGALLSALVFYSVLFHEKPEKIPEKISLNTRKKGNVTLQFPEEIKKKFADIAWKTSEKFFSKDHSN